MAYLTVWEINSYLWTSWEDTLLTPLLAYATAEINKYLWVETLEQATYNNEEYDFISNWLYFLKQINPTSLSQVDWVAFTWDYKLEWRQLKFYLPLTCNDPKWNKIKFTYTAWFVNIPNDIKKACLDLIWFYYNNRKTMGMTWFSQWQTSVNYWSNKTQMEVKDSILSNLNWYKKNNLFTIWF